MFRKLKNVMVELSTPKGSVFSGQAGGVEMRTTDGVITINPREESYLNLTQTTEITLRACSLKARARASTHAASALPLR
ncbi:MAG TPA: hypothetical protein VFD27_18795 [Chthoniobacteraceae bacterium]|jgi:F0F1-type ATP synthase epsilon subunit|nr:hypothetical protein [Chthoniobacteraceae bacterium]